MLENLYAVRIDSTRSDNYYADLYRHAKIFSSKVFCLEYLNGPWIQNKVDKIRWIEEYKSSKIHNYNKVYI